MKQYFYNDNSISKIRKIESCYRETIIKFRDINNLISNNVCKNGIWFDDNAIVFANWWNAENSKVSEGEKNDIGGDLKWDESQNKLVSDTSNVKASVDGMERFTNVMQRMGKTFYIAVCKSLAALASSHINVKNQCKIYIQLAQSKKYTLKDKNGWATMMADDLNIADNHWMPLTVPSNSNGKTTSVVRLQNFQKEIETKLNEFDECVDNYYKEILTLVNNTDTSKWWGFSDDVRSQVKKAVKSYSASSDRRIKNFKRNLNLAISKTIEAKGKDLGQIMEENMASDFE